MAEDGWRNKDLSAGLLPKWPQCQCWARLKPRVRSFPWVSCVGIGSQALRPSSPIFPDTLAGNYIGNGGIRTRVHTIVAGR